VKFCELDDVRFLHRTHVKYRGPFRLTPILSGGTMSRSMMLYFVVTVMDDTAGEDRFTGTGEFVSADAGAG
jgi:hypothetical protein